MRKLFVGVIMMLMFAAMFCTNLCTVANAAENKVLQTKYAKLTTEDAPYKVVLKGSQIPDAQAYENIQIDIYNYKGTKLHNIVPSQSVGYSPDIFIGDFFGDGTQQILLSIQSGGSGAFGYYYIYSLQDNKINTVFDFEQFSKQSVFKAKYLDNYKVLVEGGGSKYLLDLALRDKEYLSQIYKKNGKLIAPKEAYVNDLNVLFPLYNYEAQKFDILILQRITGLYNADLLGYMQTRQTYQNGKFITNLVFLNVLGTP